VGARSGLAGLLIAASAACGCAARDDARERAVACLRASGWVETARPDRNAVILEAGDGHAKVELVFWASEAAARASVPALAPIGVGWWHNVSFRSSYGFTYADEQAVERCL
jgi:hypothetical protein